MKNTVWFAAITVFLLGCDSKIEYVELKMSQKNPMSYAFDKPLVEVRAAIKSIRFPGRSVESSEDSIIIWGKIVTRPENKNDFFIFNMLPNDTSIVFRSKERPIPYFYSLHLHITSIDSQTTLVEVRTVDPSISIGVRFPHNILPSSVPGAALTKPVQPSTIEEYKVLLKIGEVLGVREKMPPLRLPEAFFRE